MKAPPTIAVLEALPLVRGEVNLQTRGKVILRSNARVLFPDLPPVANGQVAPVKKVAKGRKKLPVELNDASEVAQPRVVDPRNKLNDLTSVEWIPETVSVWSQKGLGANHPDAQIERQHPAPFSFTDVSRIIRFFTKANDLVLDPFVGVGSTLKACALEGRSGIGFELNPKYAELAIERLRTEVRDVQSGKDAQRVLVGDARDLLKQLKDDSVDLVMTSPPYWNILHKEDHKAKQVRKANALDTRYGDDARDLGNVAEYPKFLEALTTILGDCGRVLKRKKYMAVVVSDFRMNSDYVMFHADLSRSLSSLGLETRGLTVLYQRHKQIFPYGYPYAYVPNIHHQYILILQNMKPA